MAPNQGRRWASLSLTAVLTVGLLGGGGCLSMPTGGPDAGPLAPDALSGTWLASVDTANLAPFEMVLFKAPDDSGSAQLLGFSRIPEFASHMGMNVIRPGPLRVTLTDR